MSILSRLTQNGHLDDRTLAAMWADAAAAGVRPAHPHLTACPPCRAKAAAFDAWMDDIRAEGVSEADQAFPAERLAAQQAHILRRLEASERPARVIAFPRFTRPMSASTSSARRWIASAAAAGLLVGVGLGQFMDLRGTLGRQGIATADRVHTAQTRPPAAAGGIQPASLVLSDEELMSQLEEITSPRIPDTLVAYDSMTPRARDYR